MIEEIQEIRDDYNDSKEWRLKELQSRYIELKSEIERWENEITKDEAKDLDIPLADKVEDDPQDPTDKTD